MAKGQDTAESLGVAAARFARLAAEPSGRARKTTADHIADALRAAIYDGQFADGEELNQVGLARYFKVSRVPIREALRRLQAEGLVSDAAHRRALVIGLDLGQIVEAIEIRAVLEGHLVAKAGPRLDAATLARLRKLCAEMERLTEYDYNWVLKNWEFHRRLYGPSGSPAAIQIVERLALKVERYVRRAGQPERQREASAEHRRILAAVERERFAEARAEMQAHILRTGEEVRRYFETGAASVSAAGKIPRAAATSPAPAAAPAAGTGRMPPRRESPRKSAGSQKSSRRRAT
jgi:DNA-binding GntR family transcriptional regulator